jgi:MFS family permease
MAAFRFSDCGAPCRVAGARVLDRLGTGTRPAPHDALVASSADEANRGKAFGLEGSGDNAGAFLGPLVTVFFLYSLHAGIRSIFYVAVIPGLFAFFIILLVKERPALAAAKSKIDVSPWRNICERAAVSVICEADVSARQE